jgi:glycine hydroxymethyltransferase
LAEIIEFGEEYAKQVIKNAKMLAYSLANVGFNVLGEKRGFTESHQLAVDVSRFGDGGTIEKDLEKCNIILNRQLLPGDIKEGKNYLHPSGIRIGVPEVTRLGMKENEMHMIATFIKRIVIDKQDTSKVLQDVIEFRKSFQKVQYAFNNETAAYEYIQLVNSTKNY